MLTASAGRRFFYLYKVYLFAYKKNIAEFSILKAGERRQRLYCLPASGGKRDRERGLGDP